MSTSTVRELILQQEATYKDKVFLIAPETNAQLSYSLLLQQSEFISNNLDAMKIAMGDKVALLMENSYWSAMLFLGIMYSGRVIVPLNAVSGESALDYVINHSDAKIILVDKKSHESFSGLLDSLPESINLVFVDEESGPDWPTDVVTDKQQEQIQSEDTALLIYTSGTTGRPKGVLLTHKNVIAGGSNTALAHELTEADRALCVLPLYHINAEMVTIMGPLVSGASVVLPKKFSTSNFWDLLGKYQCTWFSVVPTIIAYLIERAEREGFAKNQYGGLQQLKFGRSASAALAPEIHKRFEELFKVPIVETMGLSETAAQILSNPMPPSKPKYGSPGIAVGNEVKVVDELGNTCPVGVSGELMIRGDNVTKGYYKNPGATTDALESDGWLHTGDIAMCDRDGYFFITGRIKELIIKGGENIAPREIDEALYEHPAILEAAGFAVPDVTYGQEIMACVALKPGTNCTEDELSELLKQKIGSFKTPKQIFFASELPKGPSGKIQRLKLPDLCLNKR